MFQASVISAKPPDDKWCLTTRLILLSLSGWLIGSLVDTSGPNPGLYRHLITASEPTAKCRHIVSAITVVIVMHTHQRVSVMTCSMSISEVGNLGKTDKYIEKFYVQWLSKLSICTLLPMDTKTG